MPLWLTALLGLALFAIGLVGLLRRRSGPAGLVGPLLMVAGDLLVILAALVHWADLSTQAVLLMLLALLPIDVAGAWLLWKRLGTADKDGEAHDREF